MTRLPSAAAYKANDNQPPFPRLEAPTVGLDPKHITGSLRLAADFPSAVLYRVTETDDRIHVEADLITLPEHEKLVTMQQAVGGNVEHIHIGGSRHRKFIVYDGWVNEEGRLHGMPVGVRLRVSTGTAPQSILIPCAGNLLVTAGETLSGETVALTPDEIRDLVLLTMSAGQIPVVSLSPELPDA